MEKVAPGGWVRMLSAFVLVFAGSTAMAEKSSDETTGDDTDSLFGLTRVLKIHLHVTGENWKAMQPAGGFPGFGPPPPGAGPGGPGGAPGPRPAGPPPAFRPGSFGFDFDYVKANVEVNGEPIKDIGLRFKGNGTYMLSGNDRKRPFKVDFNRYVDDQRFHGLQQLNLHNNVMDPTHVRTALSYPVFQAAGIPAPRTAFAEVTITIDGECERELLGIYTVVEEVDKRFLKRHYQTSKGMLLKPKGTQGLEYKGDQWDEYAWFEPQSKPKTSETQRFIEAVKLIHKSDDETFRREIGEYLDIDEVARFLAANVLLANMDSFLTHVHNYYVYLSPSTNKLSLLPWDMDLSMGAFFFAGSPEQLQDLSIRHPHVGDNKLLDRLFAWDDFDRQYRQQLKELTETCFGPQGSTVTNLPLVQAAIKDLVDRDAKRVVPNRGPGGGPFGPGPGMFGASIPLETFIEKRRESVMAQLAGTSKGRTPAMGFGPGAPGGPPGGPGGGPPGGFGPGNFHGPQMLQMGDSDKNQKLSRQEFADLGAKWFAAWDQDKNESLSEDEIKTGMNETLAPPANAPGGFKPPAGFGPGTFLGPALLKAADSDKNGKVSKTEWTSLFGIWMKEWDKDGDEGLDNGELVAGFNKVFAPPGAMPGFGPPGGPRPPGGTAPPGSK